MGNKKKNLRNHTGIDFTVQRLLDKLDTARTRGKYEVACNFLLALFSRDRHPRRCHVTEEPI